MQERYPEHVVSIEFRKGIIIVWWVRRVNLSRRTMSCTRRVVGLLISIRESGDVTILDLRGRATIGADSELLTSHLEELVANGVRKLLLNLADLTQVDSSAVSTIARLYVSLGRQGGDMKLLRPCGRVLMVLKVIHLLDIIPSFDDETQALASFQPQGYSAKP